MTISDDIIFIRHAENINNPFIPNDMLTLTKLGVKQAQGASKLLRNKFDIVVCSTSKRAIMTAEIIAPDFNIFYDERLLERGWKNTSHGELETHSEARKRLNDLLIELINRFPNKKILLVTHGSLIILSQEIIETPNCNLTINRVENCDIIKYTKDKRKVLIKNSLISK